MTAELLRLGHALADAYAIETAAFADLVNVDLDDTAAIAGALFQKSSDIVGQIEAIPATTLAGLTVKRQALAWCYEGEPVTAEELAGHSKPSSDMRLVAGILADLSAIGGAV